jgi:hypothetical protein
MSRYFTFIVLFMLAFELSAQCPTCGNGAIDAGETNANCPQDVPKSATCASPCARSTSFESAAGVRVSLDFVGTTTWTTAGLPAGWAFAGAPSATTAGTLPTADTYGAKAGLIQPNCSGSCASTNGFCIGNLASNAAGGKLGANFDGRANVTQNLSYAVLRGQGSPTLVSQTFNFSAVEGFKIQFWLFPSESSCGQSNAWGSCVGNQAFLDFSANGGTTWAQVLTINLSSTNSDMCSAANNASNTLWLNGSSWSRVCLTVFKSSTSPGNFYTAATGSTAASGMMVNSAFFTNNFKFRVRYSQTASCTAGITTTNPGRYLAIDYPVVTSGNEMIPCGISFARYCGYGEDNNDDGVGSSTQNTNSIVFSTVRSSVNQAERGVEIFNSQNASFAAQNTSGSNFTTNFDLCNAEGGDRQCIDWNANNNNYFVVYECVADWEAASGTGINVAYYKNGAAQSVGMTKVTALGKTAAIGWRYSANRFVSCGSSSDLNAGCNGYLFRSGSLPTQFARGFYTLATNTLGAAWSYYGASSCSHYFNGPHFAPIAIPDPVPTAPNFTACNGSGQLVFTGDVDFCSSSAGFSGSPTILVTGAGGFSENITAGQLGAVSITMAGDYVVKANTPNAPTQCIDCGRTVCVTVTDADIADCIVLNAGLIGFDARRDKQQIWLSWQLAQNHNIASVALQRSHDGQNFVALAQISTQNSLHYDYLDPLPAIGYNYYRLKIRADNGSETYSDIITEQIGDEQINWLFPNPAEQKITVFAAPQAVLQIFDPLGKPLQTHIFANPTEQIDISQLPQGVCFARLMQDGKTRQMTFVKK